MQLNESDACGEASPPRRIVARDRPESRLRKLDLFTPNSGIRGIPERFEPTVWPGQGWAMVGMSLRRHPCTARLRSVNAIERIGCLRRGLPITLDCGARPSELPPSKT